MGWKDSQPGGQLLSWTLSHYAKPGQLAYWPFTTTSGSFKSLLEIVRHFAKRIVAEKATGQTLRSDTFLWLLYIPFPACSIYICTSQSKDGFSLAPRCAFFSSHS